MGSFWNKLFGGGKKAVEAQQTPAAQMLQEKMEQMNLAAHGVPSDTAVELIGEKGVLASIVLLSLLEAGINRFPQISSYYITLIWGAVLLLVMVLNYFVEHPLARKKS